MTDVKKVDLFTAQSAQSKAVTNPVEKEKAEKERLNAEIQRELATKEDRQKAIEEAIEKLKTDSYGIYAVQLFKISRRVSRH